MEKGKTVIQGEDFFQYKVKKLGYMSKVYYVFEKKKLSDVFFSLQLNQKYNTPKEMSYSHYSLDEDLKSELKTKSEGIYITNELKLTSFILL